MVSSMKVLLIELLHLCVRIVLLLENNIWPILRISLHHHQLYSKDQDYKVLYYHSPTPLFYTSKLPFYNLSYDQVRKNRNSQDLFVRQLSLLLQRDYTSKTFFCNSFLQLLPLYKKSQYCIGNLYVHLVQLLNTNQKPIVNSFLFHSHHHSKCQDKTLLLYVHLKLPFSKM